MAHNNPDQREKYPDHLLDLIADLESERIKVKQVLGVEARVPLLSRIALASEKVGTQLRQWDKAQDRDARNLSDHQKLDDLRAWLLTLPYAYRKTFYERCALDELTLGKGVAISIG